MAEMLFDTDVLIDISRKVPRTVKFFDDLPKSSVVCFSVITQMELLAGCRNKSEQSAIEIFLADFTVILIQAGISLKARDLYAQFHLSHGIGILDCLVASTAIFYGFSFYTKNIKHFEILPNLRVSQPY